MLIDTVDALHAAVTDEIDVMRCKASFDHIAGQLRTRARAYPLRTAAIGAGLTMPLWKLGRSLPMPLLLIGASVALARPATKRALSDAIDGAAGCASSIDTRSSDALDNAWESARRSVV